MGEQNLFHLQKLNLPTNLPARKKSFANTDYDFVNIMLYQKINVKDGKGCNHKKGVTKI